MYTLTLNGHPLYVSKSKERLEKKMKSEIERWAENDCIQVIDKKEDEITYYTGIHYETDKYRVVTVEEI